MGNQLFQYAALYGLYKKTGFEMRIPKPPKNVKRLIADFFSPSTFSTP